MSRHTPGPWHVDAYGCHNDYKLRLCEPMRSGFPLATIAQFQYNWRDAGQYDRQISYKEAEANALLASTAPDLLKATQALGAMPEGYCFCSKDRIGDDSKVHEPECHDLRAAIAKATGL